MPHFVKVSADITTSSIWSEADDVLRVWLYLLASADPDGVVRVTIPALAMQNRLTLGRAQEIVDRLSAPDPYSRSRVANGRRVEVITEPEFAIRLVNYLRYRQRDYTGAERQRRYRERHGNARNAVTPLRVTQVEVEVESTKDLASHSGEARPSTPRDGRRRSAKTDPNVKVLIDHYSAEFLRLRGCKPVIRGGAAGQSFKTLLAGRTLDDAKAIVSEFLAHPPSYFADKGLIDPQHVVQAANTILARRTA